MNDKDVIEVYFAQADVVTSDFYVYPEETLREMAKDPRFRYDESARILYLRVESNELNDGNRELGKN